MKRFKGVWYCLLIGLAAIFVGAGYRALLRSDLLQQDISKLTCVNGCESQGRLKDSRFMLASRMFMA